MKSIIPHLTQAQEEGNKQCVYPRIWESGGHLKNLSTTLFFLKTEKEKIISNGF